MSRTKQSARKSTGGKPPRKQKQKQGGGGTSADGPPSSNGGKAGKKARKAAAKAEAAANDPKHTASTATKKLETQISETWQSQKAAPAGTGDAASGPPTTAAPVSPS
ncbi:hypothetical protein FRC09_018236 [Ceratobasidium sp. 395]|nr:hypothetical protein FRC09_018236 [Ceratobasidium sp. 395]